MHNPQEMLLEVLTFYNLLLNYLYFSFDITLNNCILLENIKMMSQTFVYAKLRYNLIADSLKCFKSVTSNVLKVIMVKS